MTKLTMIMLCLLCQLCQLCLLYQLCLKNLVVATKTKPGFSHSQKIIRGVATADPLYGSQQRRGFFFSTRCNGFKSTDMPSCTPCQNLKYSTELNKIQLNSCSVGNGQGHAHSTRTMAQLKESLKVAISKNKLASIEMYQTRKSLSKCSNALGMYRRLVLTISSNNIPRINKLLAVALKSGYSVTKILEMVAASIDGKYTAKGFDDKDLDLQNLAHLLGGGRLVYALQKATGAPSLTTIRRVKHMPRFQCTHGLFKQSIVENNIASMVSSYDFDDCPPLIIVMSDEVAIEPTPSVDLRTNEITGICCEHADKVSLLVTSHEVPGEVRAKVDSGVAHLASESLITSMAFLGGESAIAIPIFATGTCKTGGYLIQITQITGCLNAVKEVSAKHLGGGKVVAYATDGDGARRQANCRLFLRSELSSTSPLFKHLKGLRGLDLRVGDDDIVASSDDKHLFKRVRKRVTSSTVNISIGSALITSLNVETMLRLCGTPNDEIKRMINPDDPMNVSDAMKLLKSVARIHLDIDRSELSVGQASLLPAYALLKSFFDGLLSITDTSMTIREQLISRSRLAHIVGFIYSINGNKFINSQTYHDLQVSVKAGYFIAAWFLNRSQTGLNNLLLMMIGSDLQEELHGILRTLSHNRNFSMLSLQHNLSNAQQMAHLFERNPKWQRKDRRRDSDGRDLCRVRDWAKDALVLSPTESLESLWMEGSCMGKTDLIQSKLFDCRAISIFSRSSVLRVVHC